MARRRVERLFLVWVLLLSLSGCRPADSGAGQGVAGEEDQRTFEARMEELALAWNQGDARRAADCFTADAVYSEPPDKQLYQGRQALFEFFGGADGRAGQMRMTWHHLAYDAASGIGFGEFSFTYGSTVHGVAVVRLVEGKIGNWREYWYESELPWEGFTANNPF